jgi:hypothetical protein
MTPDEHAAEAEHMLERASALFRLAEKRRRDVQPDVPDAYAADIATAQLLTALAQVHATLALRQPEYGAARPVQASSPTPTGLPVGTTVPNIKDGLTRAAAEQFAAEEEARQKVEPPPPILPPPNRVPKPDSSESPPSEIASEDET